MEHLQQLREFSSFILPIIVSIALPLLGFYYDEKGAILRYWGLRFLKGIGALPSDYFAERPFPENENNQASEFSEKVKILRNKKLHN